MSDHQCLSSASPMSPGTYLRKRRIAAGFSREQIAGGLAALHLQSLRCCFDVAPKPASFLRRLAAKHRLGAAEEDRLLFTLREVEQLGLLIHLDPGVYEQLVDLHLAGADSGLPIAHVCRACACSFLDPCAAPTLPCAAAGRGLPARADHHHRPGPLSNHRRADPAGP